MNEGLLKDKLSLEIHPEKRRGKVIYDGQMYHAKVAAVVMLMKMMRMRIYFYIISINI